MSTFSKKNEIFFFSIAIILLIIGSVTALFTEQFLDVLPVFLETHVFHRTFNFDSYKTTMVSLLSYPMFISILFSAVCFVRFSDKSKSALIIAYIVSVMTIIFIISFTKAINYTNPDLSSEILFAQECFQKKTFWPTSWYYSMEFRLLNTQLITAPLFFFTKDLRIIRAVTVVLCEAVLFISTYFILHELKIQKIWCKLLGGLFSISPVSWSFFCYVHEESYYIPHIAFSFFYVGLFISIAFHEHSVSKKKLLFIVFCILSFISGLSSIRYILNFTFPLAAVIVYNKARELIENKISFNIKTFVLKDKQTFYSVTGLVLSGIGYVLNSTVLAAIYSFKNMNKIRFNPISIMRVDDIIDMILTVGGYNANVSVFTPGGITNILLLIVAICTVTIFFPRKKIKLTDFEKLFLQFVVFMACFSLYTNICTEMIARYLTMVFIYFIPVLAIIIQNNEVIAVKKWILSVSSAALILTNAFLCFMKFQTDNWNEKLLKVCSFLEEKGYEFGYAFSNIANPIWFITNGKVEVAIVKDETVDDTRVIPEKMQIHKWLESKRFTDINYYQGQKNIFFAIKTEEYNASANKDVLSKGNLVYQDDNYLVFDYATPQSFKDAF